MPEFSPESVHNPLLEKAPRILRFDPDAYFPEWQSAVRRTFKQLLGNMPAPVPLDLQILSEEPRPATPNLPAHTEISFLFTSEPHAQVPCTLLLPAATRQPPVMICLQGHSTGAHISLGRPKYPGDEKAIEGDRDYGLQALRQGYAALVLEQRAFGQRTDARPNDTKQGYLGCHHSSLVALLLGRTMAGERVLDVTRAIDLLTTQFADRIDPARIAIMGNSGGGLITYLAAAYDPRIAAAMPSCAICTVRHSIGTVGHCADNYIPNFLHYFDTADLAGLIAPRPLIIVAGETDPLFPLPGVKECFAEIQQIYKTQSAPEKVQLLIGNGGHRFYADLAWPTLKKLTGW